MNQHSENIIYVIKNIPAGKVISYGKIAALAGLVNGARQVVRILHSRSKKDNLPWFRVVNKEGKIGIKESEAVCRQKELLENEGVVFTDDCVDDKYFWQISSMEEIYRFNHDDMEI
ncbi:MAG: MGMT family protein [Spirochaetes bacterium]|nr:MGMT family protein [Spirochaetota bacterium]